MASPRPAATDRRWKIRDWAQVELHGIGVRAPSRLKRLGPVGDRFGVLQLLERDIDLRQPELLALVEDDRSRAACTAAAS